jgi:hypothetical protein
MSYVPPRADKRLFDDRSNSNRHGCGSSGGGSSSSRHSHHRQSSRVPQSSKREICAVNKLDYERVRSDWKTERHDVRDNLFPRGSPRYILDTDIWKPVINAYFAWYEIPREDAAGVWADIVDCLLRMPPVHSMGERFEAWAYGCFCRFYLMGRRPRESGTGTGSSSSSSNRATETLGGAYDPENPSY